MPSSTSGLSQNATPLLVGFLGNCILFGIMVDQIYWYYMSFPKDSTRLKSFVAVLTLLQSAQTGMICYNALAGYAMDFGSPAALDDVHTAWLNMPILSAIIALLVQSFFAWRIYRLSHSWIAVVLIEVISLLQCGAGIAGGIIILSFKAYSLLPQSRSASLSIQIWLATSAACDILISAIMVFLLLREPTRFRKTQVLVSKLVRLTIETGAITAVCAVIVLVLFSTIGGSSYAAFGALVPALYSNVALVVLNSRIRIASGREEEQHVVSSSPACLHDDTRSMSPPVFALNMSLDRPGPEKNTVVWDEDEDPAFNSEFVMRTGDSNPSTPRRSSTL